MKVTIDSNELRKQKLFVATPMFGEKCYGAYSQSMLALQRLFDRMGIEITIGVISNDSLIMRARNYLVDEFLRSGYTHMLFIDADIEFDPKDVLVLFALNKDIIGGPYPKKAIDWNQISRAVKMFPDLEPGELKNLAGNHVFNADFVVERIDEMNDVLEIGTGFMMIKREVFLKMRKSYPMLRYKPDHIGHRYFDGSRYIHAYFHCIIDSKDSLTGGGTDRYLSEDYTFCQLWKKLGGQIYLCPWIVLKHIGNYSYMCNLPMISRLCNGEPIDRPVMTEEIKEGPKLP